MRKISCLLLVVGATLLSACATTYVQPQPNTVHAIVQGSDQRSSLFSWRTNNIDSIDNKSVVTFLFSQPRLRVQPGNHLFVSQVTFKRGFLSNQYYGLVSFTANVKPGQSYQVKSAINGTTIQAWLEDSYGHRASTVGTGSYSIVPDNNPVVIVDVKR